LEFTDFTDEFELSCDMGLSPDDFWKLTHAEFCDMVDGWVRNQKREKNNLVELAWRMVNYGHYRELPDLKTQLIDVDGKAEEEEQTPEQMLTKCKLINIALGGITVEV
jgi:hypothetical protein